MATTLKQYQQEAENGNVEAMLILGDIYQQEKDYYLAAEWYEKAAMNGNLKGMILAFLLYNMVGHAGLKIGTPEESLIELEKAEHWLKQAIINGYNSQEVQSSVDSLHNDLGDCYFYCKRYKEAFENYKKAVTHNSSVNMGIIALTSLNYDDKLNLTNDDYIEAFHKLSNTPLPSDKLSKETNADGFNLLGHMLQLGIGIQQNPKEARKRFKQAEQLGSVEAKATLKELSKKKRILITVVVAIAIILLVWAVMRS